MFAQTYWMPLRQWATNQNGGGTIRCRRDDAIAENITACTGYHHPATHTPHQRSFCSDDANIKSSEGDRDQAADPSQVIAKAGTDVKREVEAQQALRTSPRL